MACLVHLIPPVQQVVLGFLNPLGQGILEVHLAQGPADLVDLRQNVPLVQPLNHLETMAAHRPCWVAGASQAQGEQHPSQKALEVGDFLLGQTQLGLKGMNLAVEFGVKLLKRRLGGRVRRLGALDSLFVVLQGFGVLNGLTVQLVQRLQLGLHHVIDIAHGSALLVQNTGENERNLFLAHFVLKGSHSVEELVVSSFQIFRERHLRVGLACVVVGRFLFADVDTVLFLQRIDDDRYAALFERCSAKNTKGVDVSARQENADVRVRVNPSNDAKRRRVRTASAFVGEVTCCGSDGVERTAELAISRRCLVLTWEEPTDDDVVTLMVDVPNEQSTHLKVASRLCESGGLNDDFLGYHGWMGLNGLATVRTRGRTLTTLGAKGSAWELSKTNSEGAPHHVKRISAAHHVTFVVVDFHGRAVAWATYNPLVSLNEQFPLIGLSGMTFTVLEDEGDFSRLHQRGRVIKVPPIVVIKVKPTAESAPCHFGHAHVDGGVAMVGGLSVGNDLPELVIDVEGPLWGELLRLDDLLEGLVWLRLDALLGGLVEGVGNR